VVAGWKQAELGRKLETKGGDAFVVNLAAAGDGASPGARISTRDVCRGNEKMGVPRCGVYESINWWSVRSGMSKEVGRGVRQ
jgi:hypothetical protein